MSTTGRSKRRAAERAAERARPHMTQEEVAEELGVTRARVQQIEAAALRKLRRVVGSEVDRWL